MFKKAVISLSLAFVSVSAFASPTKVTQYMYSMDLNGYNTETGEKKTPPKDKFEVIRNSNVVDDVSYFSADNTQLKIRVSGGNRGRSTIYLQFRSADSARILKDLLTNGNESLVMLYDYYSSDVRLPDVKADALYIWSDKSQSVMKVGELIGPRRSVEEQSYYDQLMVYLFGRSHLNKVKFIEFTNKQAPTTSL